MRRKIQMKIKSYERRQGKGKRETILGTEDLSDCSEDKLETYLEYLQHPENKEKHQSGVDRERQELINHIRKGEKKLHVAEKDLDDMDIDQLSQYLNDLRSRYKSERKDTKEKADSADKTSQASADEAQQQDQTDSNETVKQLPEELTELLQEVADRYNVEAEAIFDEYIELRAVLDRPYPLDEFKKVLRDASKGCIVFEAGFIRPLKLNYTDKLTHNRITVYRLTEISSKDDIVKECHKAEVVSYELGASEKHILTKRAKSVGQNRLDKASKDTLLEYLWQLYDLINERLTKLGGEKEWKRA